MEESLQSSSGLKVTFYTHPLCEASWKMHQDWIDFYRDYHRILAIKFCLGEIRPENVRDTKNHLKGYISLAVKAASLQSERAAHLYLAALREAVCAQDADTLNSQLPVTVARRVAKQHPSQLDFNRFVSDMAGKQTSRALNEDLKKIHLNRIGIIPTITFTREGKGIKLEGIQTYRQLVKAVSLLLPVGPPALEPNTTTENSKMSFG